MAKIITLTGDLGSGKSTVSAILIKELGYKYIYTGDILRDIADRKGMSVMELNSYAETHPEIDKEIDDNFINLKNEENLIVDSRLAWHFLPNSFKVFLKVEPSVAAQRIVKDKLRKNEQYQSPEEAVKILNDRKQSELKRYMRLYGVDCAEMNNYNLIIDTSTMSPDEVAEQILSEYKKFINE
ncbi:MAG: cytidylate kinase family protein [Bacteroidales bacterium]|jgi:cytidylate kinase|nr:cytidylate kinase family protein [Bacteroidales bacterium]